MPASSRPGSTFWGRAEKRGRETPFKLRYGGGRDPIHENRVSLGVSCWRGWE